MTTPIIFLDIDGVLNNAKSLIMPMTYRYDKFFTTTYLGDNYSDFYHQLAPECVQELNRIVDTTGAKIVISSSWRIGGDVRFSFLKKYLRLSGVVGEIIDKTSDIVLHKGNVMTRGYEIARWLEHRPTSTFVILDDNADMKPYMDRLVQTEFDPGLTKLDADRAIAMLQKQAK